MESPAGEKSSETTKSDDNTPMYDVLLEEIDKTISYPTFCLVRDKMGKTWVYRYNAHRALWIFRPNNWLRRRCIYLTTSLYYEAGLLFVLMAHLVASFNTSAQTGQLIEIVATWLYVVECCAVVVARGFFIGPYTFVRETLNILDLAYVIVALGSLYYHSSMDDENDYGGSSYIYIRFFRILDLLCSYSRFRIVLLTLVRAFQNITVVVGAIAGLIFVYANIGLKSFKGTLSQYCRLNSEMDLLPAHLAPGRRDYFLNLERRTVPCRHSIPDCPPKYMCLRERERDRLYFTFDNIFYSALNVLRVIILDDFEDVYEKLLDVQPAIAVVTFFGPIIFFGSLVLYSTLLNVVITTSYDLELKIEADIQARTGLYAKVVKLSSNTFSPKFIFVFETRSKKLKFVRFTEESLRRKGEEKIWKSYWANTGTSQKAKRSRGDLSKRLGKTITFLDKRYNDTTNDQRDSNVDQAEIPINPTQLRRSKSKPIEPGGTLFECDRKSCFFTRAWVPVAENDIDFDNMDPHLDLYDDFWNQLEQDIRPPSQPLSGLSSTCKRLASNEYYKNFIDICIAVNVAIVCSDHFGQPIWLEMTQLYTDILFTAIFSIELFARVAANQGSLEGLLDVWEVLLNLAGFLEVILLLRDFSFAHLDVELHTLMAVLRSLKIMRALRLPYIRKMSMKLGDFMITILVYFVILFIIIYVWSVIGYHLFRHYYRSVDLLENPFYGISRALVINIMILCGQIYKPIQQCLAETESPASFCMIYFLGGVPIFSVMIFLFEGILFHSMATTIKVNQPLFDTSTIMNYLKALTNVMHSIMTAALAQVDGICFCLNPDDNEVNGVRSRVINMLDKWYMTVIEVMTISTSATILLFDDVFALNSPYRSWILNVSELFVMIHIIGEIIISVAIKGTRNTVLSPMFMWKVLLGTLISITYINLTLVYYMQKLRRVFIFCRLFLLIAQIDAVVVTYKTILKTMTALCNSFLLSFVIWLIFASIGVSLLKGMGYECIRNEREVNLNQTMCEKRGFAWKRRYANFDNILYALDALKFLTIYQDMEGIVMAGIRSQGIGMGVKGKPRLAVTIFYMLFLIGGSYFLFSLFIGVIFDTFKGMEVERKQNIDDILNPSKAQIWINKVKRMFDVSLLQMVRKPKDDILRVFYKISLSSEYQTYCHIIIILNAIIMAFDSYELTEQGESLHKAADLIFFTFFGMEFIIKVLGQRACYFLQLTNLFNLGAIIAMLLSSAGIGKNINAYMYHLFLVLRLLEASRIFEMFPKVYKLIKVIVSALPSLMMVISVHMVLILLYASIGTFFFHDDVSQTAVFNVHHFNFKTLWHSLSVLILLTTKTKVHEIERSLHDPGNEDEWLNLIPPVLKSAAGRSISDTPYMSKHHNMNPDAVSFYVTSFMIFNLVASMLYQAIMAEYFVYANDEDDDTQSADRPISGEDVDLYLLLWDDLTDGSPYMELSMLSDFLTRMMGPLLLEAPNHTIISHMNLPVYSGHTVSSVDVFKATSWYHLTQSVLPFVEGENAEAKFYEDPVTLAWLAGPCQLFEQKFNEFFGVIVPKKIIYTTGTLLKAVLVIQRRWKRFKLKSSKQIIPYIDEY